MSKPKPPKIQKPTFEEQRLAGLQTQGLEQQNALINNQLQAQNLLSPFMYQSMGLTPQYATVQSDFDAGRYIQMNPDLQNTKLANNPALALKHWQEHGQFEGRPGGPTSSQQIVGFTQDPAFKKQQDVQNQIASLSQARTLAALKGELPVDAGVLQDLARQEKDVRQGLEKQLGTGYETSTPGIEGMARFQANKAAILDAYRRGDISLGEQLNLAQNQLQQQNTANFLAGTSGTSQLSYPLIGAYGANAAGYNNPLNYMVNNRQLDYASRLNRYMYTGDSPALGIMQGAMQGASSGAMFGPWGALIGGIGGAAMGGLGSASRGGPGGASTQAASSPGFGSLIGLIPGMSGKP